MTSEILNNLFGMIIGGGAAVAVLLYFLLRKRIDYPSDYERGVEDGYAAACAANYARHERLRNHDPKTCELCRPRGSRACTCQREASQEA